jgi:hypothetical protein
MDLNLEKWPQSHVPITTSPNMPRRLYTSKVMKKESIPAGVGEKKKNK